MSLAVGKVSARAESDQVNDALEKRGPSSATLSCRLGQDAYIDYPIGPTTAMSLVAGSVYGRVALDQVNDALEQRGPSIATASCRLGQDAYIDYPIGSTTKKTFPEIEFPVARWRLPPHCDGCGCGRAWRAG